MAQVQGTCDPKFEALKAIFQNALDQGDELGASVTVNLEGHNVVDLWGGHADAAHTRPWERDTIVNVFSASKNVASLALLMLIDQDLASPTDKVSKYWPEFAANGKENVELRHLLTHASGVPGWDDRMTWDDMFAVELPAAQAPSPFIAKLAAQSPQWEPGTATGYHAMTFGTLIGEVVRRITGLSLGEFIEQRIAGPVGADFHMGMARPDEEAARIAEMTAPLPEDMAKMPPPGPLAVKMFNPMLDVASVCHSASYRQAQIAAVNGHTNARGLVAIFENVVNGGTLEGERKAGALLSPRTTTLICGEQIRGKDLCLGVEVAFGLGFGIRTSRGGTAMDALLPPGRIALWPGFGGSVVIMDFDRKLTIGFAHNKLRAESPLIPIVEKYIKAAYEALGVPLADQSNAKI